MTISHLIPIFALVIAGIMRAADSLPIPPEPDHLVPVDPYPGDWHVRYSDEFRSQLKLRSPFFAQMVVRPSFSGEYAVRLHGKIDDFVFDSTEKFFLTYAAADTSIWYSMPENNDQKKRQKVTITFTTAELPKPLAARIQKLWERMLMRTRYPKDDSAGNDGTTYEFGTWSTYYGQTWSPQERKSPLLFVELGESLITYCKAAPEERPTGAKGIEIKAAQLEKFLNEQEAK